MLASEYLEAVEIASRQGDTCAIRKAIEGLIRLGFPRVDIFVFFERMIRDHSLEAKWQPYLTIVHALLTVVPPTKREKKMLAYFEDLWDNFV